MSGDEETPSGHANALIALSRRLRTVPAKDLPIVARGVLLAVAGRAGADWIAFPPVEWVAREAGTTPNTARRALDWLVKVSGWLGLESPATPRAAARYRIRLDPVVPSGVTERYPWGSKARGHGAAPQGSRSSTPGVTEQHPRGHGAAPQGSRSSTRRSQKDPREIPDRSQKDPNRRAGARAGDETLDLFDRSGPGASSGPKGSERDRPAKLPRERTAAERYADAFVEAFTLRGRTVSRPTTAETAMLGKLCRDHARDRAGAALVGDALPVWIRAQVVAMLDGVEDFTRHRGGASVHGLRHWLDTAGPARVRELEPKSAARPALADDDAPFCEPPAMRDEDVLRAALTLPPGEGRDAVVAKYQARVGVGV